MNPPPNIVVQWVCIVTALFTDKHSSAEQKGHITSLRGVDIVDLLLFCERFVLLLTIKCILPFECPSEAHYQAGRKNNDLWIWKYNRNQCVLPPKR